MLKNSYHGDTENTELHGDLLWYFSLCFSVTSVPLWFKKILTTETRRTRSCTEIYFGFSSL
jgi:hypothetical protein